MADNNVGNLSLGITSSVTRAVNSINKLTTSLQKSNNELIRMNGLASASPIAIGLGAVNKGLASIDTQAKLTTKSVQTMSGTLGSLKNVGLNFLGFGSLQQGINTVTGWFTKGFDQASGFVENFNLFNVSMKGSTEEAIRYQNLLNQSFQVNMSESMRYQGFFKNLANSLGITNDASTLLSTNLTNLTYDLSSLYNVDFSTMYSKLQSGIVGQTKPLRSVGIDVTQQTLQPMLYEMGINKYVTELTQAEKVLLRYMAILKQSDSAHGDFARTIETPANQMRIFNDQIKELQRWFGTMFIGTLGSILPYINAFVIALKEIFKWVSLAFGFNVEDYDFLAEQDQGAIDLGSDLEDTLGTSEKLKKSLMGFDELNNLGEASSGSGNMPNIGLSDTYYELLDNLKGYDNLMGSVSARAGKISEDILNWLGFTKQVNSLTGEITYQFQGISGWFGVILGGFAILTGVSIFNKIKSIVGLIGSTSDTGAKAGLVGVIAKVATMFVVLGHKILLAFGFTTGSVLVASLVGLSAVIAVVVSAVALFNYGMKDTVKEVEIFGEGISDLTKRKVEPFIDVMGDLERQFDRIDLGNDIVDDADVSSVETRLGRITSMIIAELDSDKNQALQKLEPLRYAFGDEAFDKLLDSSETFYEKVRTTIKTGEDRINTIVALASKERRELTKEEQQEINQIQADMKKTGITLLSETSTESQLIFQRIKDQSVELSKRQTLDILVESVKLRDETIKNAQEQYYGILTEADRMLAVGAINKEQYNEIVRVAKITRDDTIRTANEQFDGIKKSAEERFPKITKFLDEENQKIKKNWEVIWESFKVPFSFMGTPISKFLQDAIDMVNILIQKFGEWLGQVASGAGGVDLGSGGVGYDAYGTIEDEPKKITKTWHYLSNTGTESQMRALKSADLKKATSISQASAINAREVKYYANGGMPSTGEMFVARENGIPEMVGSIGGRSAVMNNNQIVEAVAQGVAQAVSSVMSNDGGGNVILQVNEDVLGRVAIESINKTMKNTNLVLNV